MIAASPFPAKEEEKSPMRGKKRTERGNFAQAIYKRGKAPCHFVIGETIFVRVDKKVLFVVCYSHGRKSTIHPVKNNFLGEKRMFLSPIDIFIRLRGKCIKK